MKKISHFVRETKSFVVRNSGKIAAVATVAASASTARAEGALETAVTTALGGFGTTAGLLLAAAIVVPIAFKVFGIGKKAINKA